MDTASGSIRGSEPTSPTSPASPDARAALPPPTPLALHHALYSLHHATNLTAHCESQSVQIQLGSI